jgi:hypothetical protein
MALDHIVLSLPATTKTALFTVPKGATQCHVTIQNRDTAATMAIGDDTLSGLSGGNGGIQLPLAASATAPTTFQTWLNGGDTIYGYASAAMTNTCVVLCSYTPTASV